MRNANSRTAQALGSLVFLVIFMTSLAGRTSASGETVPRLSSGLDPFVVSGVVRDGGAQPIPGVNVVEKGTTNGTVTDADGKFLLTVSDRNAVVVFSFIGFASQEVSVGGRATLDIILSEDAQSLDEVVVVGYGTQRRSDLTGSTVSLKSEDLKVLPTQRADQALQGRAAGVLVLNTDGAPGGNTTVRIRGSNSVLGGNNALIVVDGLQGVNLNTINPNDIQSMEVLKDASATAIYGSRGANGVILITTKQGQSGKSTLSYSGNVGWQVLANKLDLMQAPDYARTVNLIKSLNNSGAPPVLPFTEAQIADFERNGGTDWQDQIYRTAPMQNHQLSISGGGASTLKYFVSAGYLKQDGIVLNTGYERYTLRANISQEINKWLGFAINFSGVKDEGSTSDFGENGGGPINGAINSTTQWDAASPPFDSEGNYAMHPPTYGAVGVWNPLAEAVEPVKSVKSLANYINAALNFKLAKGLTLAINGFATLSNSKNSNYYNEKTVQGIVQADGTSGYGTLNNGEFERYQNTNMLTYDKTVAKHHFTITGVVEQSVENYTASWLTAMNFIAGQTGINDLAGSGFVRNFSTASKRVLNSYLGRINYAFNDRYLVTASYRADGSSVFGANNKWGYFPSVSVAWRLDQESFVSDLGLFSELKLRGSFGITGNQAISPYQSFARISSGQNYPWNGGTATNSGFGVSALANPDLKWESTEQSNIGLDIGVFNGRITATVDVYKKETDDLLLYRQLPGSSGVTSIIDNIGSTENKGLEITIGGDPLVGALKWNTGFNISFNRSKVLNLGEDLRIPFTSSFGGYNVDRNVMELRVGEPFGQMMGYDYEGVWKTDQATEAAVFGQLPGDPRYRDVNNDGKVNLDDIVNIGNASPKYIFGWTNRMSFKNFDLTFLIQGTYGNDIFNQTRIRMDQDNPNSVRALNYWTPENQNTDIPGYIDAKTRQAAGLAYAVSVDGGTSRWIEDGSYVRLKNVTLGYSIPSALLSKAGIGKARVYVSGTNLLTSTDYMGYDPEVSSFNGNDAQIGIDLNNYPTAKTFLFGLDITF